MKKVSFSILILILFVFQTLACPVCERNQPHLLRRVLHGTGPDSTMDYLIVGLITLISLATLYFSIKWLIKPGEKEKNHIKRTILNNDDHE